MKKVKMTARLIAFALFALTANVFSVAAETTSKSQPVVNAIEPAQLVQSEEMVLVSDVNFNEAFVAEQNGNNLAINFSISSQKTAESNIHYVVELLKNSENENADSNEVIDRKVYEEKFSLSAGEVIQKGLQYQAPEYLKGKYSVLVYAENDSGMILSFIKAGDVELTGNGQFLEISDCYLTVNGEKTGDRDGYFSKEGVDIKKGEVLTVNCEAINNFGNNQSVKPFFKTTRRSLTGDSVEAVELPNEVVNFKAGEKKTINFELPQVSIPQAYEVTMSLKNSEGKIISNNVYLHYVLAGESATIQNVRLDKTGYRAGELAEISVFLTGSADSFEDSRTGGTANSRTKFRLEVVNDENVACINPIEREINIQESFFALKEKVLVNCINPRVEISLSNQDGLLDERQYSFTSTEIEKNQVAGIYQKENVSVDKIKWIVLSMVILLLIIFLILVLMILKNKNDNSGGNKIGGSTLRSLALLFLLGGTFLFFDTKDVFAAKYCNGAKNALCVTVNVKPQYCAGEANSTSLIIDAAGCNNYYFWGRIEALGTNIGNFSNITHGTSQKQTFDFSRLSAGRHTITFNVKVYQNCKSKFGYRKGTRKNFWGDDCTKDKDRSFSFTETFNVVDCKATCSSAYHGKSLNSITPGDHLCGANAKMTSFKEKKNTLGTLIGWDWSCNNQYGQASCWAIKPCVPNWQDNNPEWEACPTDVNSCENNYLYQKRTITSVDLNKCEPPKTRVDKKAEPCGECGKCGTQPLNLLCGKLNTEFCPNNECCSSGWIYRPARNELKTNMPAVNGGEVYMLPKGGSTDIGIKKIGNNANRPYTGYQWQCGNRINDESKPPISEICEANVKITGVDFKGSLSATCSNENKDCLVIVKKADQKVSVGMDWKIAGINGLDENNRFERKSQYSGSYSLANSDSANWDGPIKDDTSLNGHRNLSINGPGKHTYTIKPYCGNQQKDGLLETEVNIELQCDKNPSPWSACSVQCGGGTRTRTETDPITCQQITVQDNNCNPQPCSSGVREY